MKSKKLFFRGIICLVVSSLYFISPARAEKARDIAKEVFPSIVMLLMEDNNGQPLSLGSGFFVREDIVATNLHVIQGAAGGYAKIVGKKAKYGIAGYVAIDERWDLILLKIKDANAPALSFGDSSKIAVGDEIFAVGNPKGLEGTFSKGIISAIRKIEEDTLLQITAPISPGSSGGPVLNNEGDVIGISVATFKGGQNLNFAIPASYLSKLLFELKPVKKLAIEKKPKKKVKSILNDLGGRNTEGVIGHTFLWDSYADIYGEYTFSLQNKLRTPVNNVYCLIVFYDRKGDPIEIDVVNYQGTIPAGLAKRINSRVDDSVYQLTTDGPYARNTNKASLKPVTKLEFRILDFRIVEDSGDGV